MYQIMIPVTRECVSHINFDLTCTSVCLFGLKSKENYVWPIYREFDKKKSASGTIQDFFAHSLIKQKVFYDSQSVSSDCRILQVFTCKFKSVARLRVDHLN